MNEIRQKRIESIIKEKISQIILQNKVKDPRVDKLISITEVALSRDSKYAKVYVSYFGEKENHGEVVDALNHAAGFIQKTMGKTLQIKSMPKLTFILDNSIEHGFNIIQKLKDLVP
ncbi:MAG: 30S ribosome-binding factor RbfA [Spirochaetales bacterium]|nr:30S ribosome-binding factor RbfA [Spirochaetales bacterium]